MLAILQPFIPHYRNDFFKGLHAEINTDIFCYENKKRIKGESFKIGDDKNKTITSFSLGPFLFYDPFKLLSKEYNQIVLMLHFGHITTWILLLLKPFYKKKIILWGQGISVKRYMKEEVKPSLLLKMMIYLSDGVWLYTEKEKAQWEKIFPNKSIVSLNNTISGINNVINYSSLKSKNELKSIYNIKQEICFIFCARFNNNYRRQDLLIKIIKELDNTKYGFIIIGDGNFKPNFSDYNNVYDYGSVYDVLKKQDLFTIADLYIQPGWVGLSIVEALGYGKPIITFERSMSVLQCVEYYYLKNNINALIYADVESFLNSINNLNKDQIKDMSFNSKKYVRDNLMMNKMINTAISTL